MPRLRRLVCLPLLLALLAVAAGCRDRNEARTYRGTLAEGDDRLESGEYADAYPVRVRAGQWVLVQMASTAFTPYLILRGPSGEQTEGIGAGGQAVVRYQAGKSGVWTVQATSREAGDVGAYTLSVAVSNAAAPAVSGAKKRLPAPSDTTVEAASPAEAASPDTAAVFVVRPGRTAPGPETPPTDGSPGGGFSRQVQGALEEGDPQLSSGEYVDMLDLEVQRGQTIVIEMVSRDFDAYLILRSPSGEQEESDDAGDTRNARIEVRADASGTYRVAFTSASPGETGTYRARLSVR